MSKFLMEIRKTSQRKSASGDNVYQIVLECENPELMELAKLPPDELVNVTMVPEKQIDGMS